MVVVGLAGSTEGMAEVVRTSRPSMTAGTSTPNLTLETAAAIDLRTLARRHSPTGSCSYGPGAVGSVGGRRVGGSNSGSRAMSGGASNESSSAPSLKRRRTKLSLEVFSSRRRTR